METLSAEQLVGWCRRTLPDDTRAFEYLVAHYKDRVFAVAYRLVGNRQEAEDLAQEVFLKIFRGIHELDDPQRLTAWIFTITSNTCLDALSKQRRRPAAVPLQQSEEEDEIRIADSGAITPEEAALRRELARCLQKTLQELDLQERAIIVMRDVEGRPYQEIADALTMGLSAVKMRIHRARLAFQRLLERICPGIWRAGPTVG